MVAAFKRQFVRKTIEERRRFYEAKQIHGEKAVEYFNLLKSLVIGKCGFDDKIEGILLEKIIAGLCFGSNIRYKIFVGKFIVGEM